MDGCWHDGELCSATQAVQQCIQCGHVTDRGRMDGLAFQGLASIRGSLHGDEVRHGGMIRTRRLSERIPGEMMNACAHRPSTRNQSSYGEPVTTVRSRAAKASMRWMPWRRAPLRCLGSRAPSSVWRSRCAVGSAHAPARPPADGGRVPRTAGGRSVQPVAQGVDRHGQRSCRDGPADRVGQGYGLDLDVVRATMPSEAWHGDRQVAINVSLPGVRSRRTGSMQASRVGPCGPCASGHVGLTDRAARAPCRTTRVLDRTIQPAPIPPRVARPRSPPSPHGSPPSVPRPARGPA